MPRYAAPLQPNVKTSDSHALDGGATWDEAGPPDVDERKPLVTAAVEYVQAGRPVVALSPDGARVVANMSPRDVAMAREWWSQRPYGIGVRCGVEFDVLEVPAAVGEAAAALRNAASGRGVS